MKRTALFGAVMAALAAPSLALADMNYTNFEVDYLDLDGDGGVNGDGFEIGGSWELNDQFHLFGSWQDQSFDGGFDGETLEARRRLEPRLLGHAGLRRHAVARSTPRSRASVTTAWRSAAAFAAVSASRSSSMPG